MRTMSRVIALCLTLVLLCGLPMQVLAEQEGFVRMYAMLTVELLGTPSLVQATDARDFTFVNIDIDKNNVVLLGAYSGPNFYAAVWSNLTQQQCVQVLKHICQNYAKFDAWSEEPLWICFTLNENPHYIYDAGDAAEVYDALK